MSIPESQSFQPQVELHIAAGEKAVRKIKPGDGLTLVARFRDFLGEPTSDTGPITITTNIGTLALPTINRAGNDIILMPGEAPINAAGELPIVFHRGRDFGGIEISLRCDLGNSELHFVIPAPSGFALAEMMESVIFAFLVAIVIRIFFFQTFWIPSGSMEPTLYEGDRIIANKLIYRLRQPERGEVVIFKVFQPGHHGSIGRLTLDEALAASVWSPPGRTGSLERTSRFENPGIEVQDYIKRVVGLPGDTVEVTGGEIYVNGEALVENFDTREPDYDNYGPITVPPGEIFVLGDNRSNSQDSHVIGTVPIRNIEGRAEAVFWPPNRISLIPQGR
jgi:signal peptidase I